MQETPREPGPVDMDARLGGVLSDLAMRISALEKSHGLCAEDSRTKSQANRQSIDDVAQDADDAFAVSMKVKGIAAGLRKFDLVRCADDYYSWSLERRRRYLGAPTTEHLCKSIVMCNTYCTNGHCDDPLNSKYYCVIVQYHTKLSASDLMRVIKQLQADVGRKPLPNKNLHFRLAEDCLAVTGYPPNAVTPLDLKTPMPIVLDRVITKLEPAFFWMGGGEVSLKLRVNVDEFLTTFKPIIGDVTPF